MDDHVVAGLGRAERHGLEEPGGDVDEVGVLGQREMQVDRGIKPLRRAQQVDRAATRPVVAKPRGDEDERTAPIAPQPGPRRLVFVDVQARQAVGVGGDRQRRQRGIAAGQALERFQRQRRCGAGAYSSTTASGSRFCAPRRYSVRVRVPTTTRSPQRTSTTSCAASSACTRSSTPASSLRSWSHSTADFGAQDGDRRDDLVAGHRAAAGLRDARRSRSS